jgi:hypothetical protein
MLILREEKDVIQVTVTLDKFLKFYHAGIESGVRVLLGIL